MQVNEVMSRDVSIASPRQSIRDAARMMAEIENWRDAPLWEPDSIAKATKTWFEYLGPEQRK